MVGRQLGEQVREKGSPAGKLQQADGCPARVPPGLRATTRGHARKRGIPGRARASADPRSCLVSERGHYFADCYSGEGGVGRAVEESGMASRWLEISHGPTGDMTCPKVMRRLAQDAVRGLLISCMMAIVCTSWTTARNRTNTIRSRAEPWGVAHPRKPLSDLDVGRLREGNDQVRKLLKFLKLLHRLRIPWCIENPANSVLWWVPQLRRYLNCRRVNEVVVDQCSFGRPWRKRSRLWFGNCDAVDVEALETCRCEGKQRCSFSAKKHIQLTGTAPNGKAWTVLAQAFPKKMCSRIAHILLQKVIDRRCRHD